MDKIPFLTRLINYKRYRLIGRPYLREVVAGDKITFFGVFWFLFLIVLVVGYASLWRPLIGDLGTFIGFKKPVRVNEYPTPMSTSISVIPQQVLVTPTPMILPAATLTSIPEIIYQSSEVPISRCKLYEITGIEIPDFLEFEGITIYVDENFVFNKPSCSGIFIYDNRVFKAVGADTDILIVHPIHVLFWDQ